MTLARLLSASSGGISAAYSYLANSPLVGQICFTNSGVRRMTTTKQYDFLNRLTSISSSGSSSSVSFAYSYNSANQRIRSSLSDGSYWLYGYDSLGQVSSGNKYWPDQTPVAGQQFGYAFDDIGNRTQTEAGGDQNGANLRLANYYANNLNQYTNRDVPGAVDVLGVAFATNSVTVGGLAPYRKGEYFRKQLSVNNSNAPVWTNITVSSPGQSSVVGGQFVPKTAEHFGYDPDGNLTNDGHFAYLWDAENRLVGLAANTSVGPQVSLAFEYDARSRRIRKEVWGNTAWSGSPTNDVRFVYDGWNLLGILNSSSALQTSFLWGLDLSGSSQGAGGVGGLLALSDSVNGSSFASFDGNGNVAALVKASDGTPSAQYEYGPFGEVLRATGPMARANPFRFSTKYQDDESDLLYYGYRYYNASTGRWLSRDPLTDEVFRILVAEATGIAEDADTETEAMKPPYLFVGNTPTCYFDALGLWPSKNHWLLYPEPNPLAHENAIDYTTPNSLPDPETAKRILRDATVEVDRHQAVRYSYMHAMRAPWQSKATAQQKANHFVRMHLVKAEILLCDCPGVLNEALHEFGLALHTVQDSTSPAHHDFQTWYSPVTDPIGALKHLKKEGFDPGPGSHLYNATADFWKYFKCALDAPALPQDFFAGLGVDQKP